MSNLNQLEREWKIYKRKERRPFVIITVIFITISSLIIFLTLSSKNENKLPKNKSFDLKVQPKLETKTSIVSVDKESNKTTKVIKKDPLPVKTQELQPSFAFMRQIKEDRYTNKQKHVKRTTHKHQIEQPSSVIKQEKKSQYLPSRNKIDVSSTSSKDKIDALAKRFNSNRNPLLGIAVAKRYLQSKKYKQAYFYALEVNNIDPKNEDSWLVSAHSLYFIKSKEAAMKLLKNYMRKHDSSKALRLYRAMKEGRLK